MKISRDTWLGLSLLLILILVTVAAALQQSQSVNIPYLSTSSLPEGALLLRLWMADLGFTAVDPASPAFEVPEGADLVLLLEPSLRISDEEWELLDEWVDGGGTLVVAGDSIPARGAMRHFDFSVQSIYPGEPMSLPQTPLLTSPPLTDPAPAEAPGFLSAGRTDFVTHLAIRGRPALVSFAQGDGRVVLSTSAVPFSNLGLKDRANAAVTLNVVALAVRSGSVWFDDWHHGIRPSEIYGPDQWLRASPLGHALLFITGAIFVALLLRGRLFGRPVPAPHEIRRRGPLEHVTAIANLNRRAGHRTTVLRQYHHRVKRDLGRRYRLDPALPDTEFVQLLSQYNPSLDQADLLDLLARLSAEGMDEADMVRQAARAAEWMNTHQ